MYGTGYAQAHVPPGGQHGVTQPPQYSAPPSNSYGAPPVGQYGAPSPGQYGAPPAGQYGAPPAGQYGAPPPGQYGAPPPGQYGTPPAGQYSAPSVGQYGVPPTGGQYGVPPAGQHRPPQYTGPPGPHAAPQQGYSAYGQPAQPQVPPGVDPVVWGWFQSVDSDRSGQISATELQRALLNNNWSHFNSETCRLMIGMFDKDRSGQINIHEFAALWKYVQDWKNTFDGFDRDRSGSIDANELNQAFSTFGFRLSPQFCTLCVRVFDKSNKRSMKLDDFIQCCVMLRTLTEKFKFKDSKMQGVININYEEFLEMVLDTTLAQA
ncbi:programmed cell death protein 6-like [Watersipora subatra]|uniref:programmed cell death protein 6-like n=1 Tax=Watersipora subatra TaxID=2589382 RepID=UPI00355C1BBE